MGQTAAGVSRIARVLPYLTFFLTGILTTVLGPILPWLSQRWALADADAGALFTLQFASSLGAGLCSGVVGTRLGETRTLRLGLAAMTAGAIGLAAGSRALALTAICVSGIGIGLTVPTANILVARAFHAKASAALSALNLMWGAGAAAWPLIVAVAPTPRNALFSASAALALLAVAAMAVSLPEPEPAPVATIDRPRSAVLSQWAFYAAFFLLYGGSETAVGGWMTEFANRLDPDAPATIATAAFWGGLTCGRAAVAVLVAEAHEARVALGGAATATLALVLLLVANGAPAAIAAAAFVGVGFAPLFPITVAVLSRGTARGAAGPLMSLTSIGGATLPWLVGVTSTRTGSLQAGLLVPLAGAILVGALQAYLWRHRRKSFGRVPPRGFSL